MRLWLVVISFLFAAVLFYFYMLFVPNTTLFERTAAFLSALTTIVIGLSALISWYLMSRPFASAPSVKMINRPRLVSGSKYYDGKKFTGYLIQYALELHRFEEHLYCGIVAIVERWYFPFGWRPLKFFKPLSEDIQFSDYEASLKGGNHSDIGKVENLRPRNVQHYFNQGGFIKAFHYFLAQHEVKKVEFGDEGGRYHVFVPDFILLELVKQKAITLRSRVRIRLEVVVYNSRYNLHWSILCLRW